MTRPVRVGVAPAVRGFPRSTGVGRAWTAILGGLTAAGTIEIVDGSPRRWRRPQLWLNDAHQGALDVDQPVVALVQEATWADPELRPLFEPWFIEAYEEPTRLGVAEASIVVTPSESSRTQVIESYGVHEESVAAIPYGVDRQLFRPDRSHGPEIVRRAGGDADRPYVLFVSTAHPRKNLTALRDAMGRLVAEGLPHQLVLVAGAPADRRDAAALLADAESPLPGTDRPVTRLEGLDDDELAELMAGAAALCQPSLMEGFGFAPLEAMACGTPVVVTDRGALPEVVGDAGVVVEASAEALAAGLRRVLTEPALAAELADRGVRRAATLTWEHTVRAWADVIRRLAP